jgi:exoribonuclease-2
MLTPDLRDVARRVMIEDGFDPDPDPAVSSELKTLGQQPDTGASLRDLRGLLWSSIDNDDTRDLDQIEFAETLGDGKWRLYIGIADVDSDAPKGSAIDAHAGAQTTTVYTGAMIFPMIPPELSTGATSLFEGAERKSVVVEMVVGADGTVQSADIYRATVTNKAQLAYPAVGNWLDNGVGIPPKVTATASLESQLRLQAQIAGALRKTRLDNGALEIETVEARAVADNGKVTAIEKTQKNTATDMIEDFMIAANGSVARFLESRHVSSIRRIVRSPERWQRIVDLAKEFGKTLPAEPDPVALHDFMLERRSADPERFPDLSLAVVKLMGPGEYILDEPGVEEPGHFGLAVQDYTHSTAPNRRYADLVTQRIVKAVLADAPPPYSDDELSQIARNCTLKEDAARKVERQVRKIAAAILFSDRVGQRFKAIVTGNKSSGTYVRVIDPPVEGRLMRGEKGVDVGDEIEVQLLSTNPQKGFIDFGRVGSTPTPNPPGKRMQSPVRNPA